jgi:hypothetical protein
MWVLLRRRLWQLALVTLAVPAAAWLLEEAARRQEARKGASASSARLRQWSRTVGRFGRGPLSGRRRPDRP